MPLPWPKTRDEIARIQRQRRIVAVERALRAPFHAERLAGIDPAKVNDPEVWAKIPILTKDELRAISPQRFRDEFCIAPRRDVAELWRSGGATGVPLFYPRTYEDMQYGILAFSRTFTAAGAEAGESAHVSFPLGIHPVGHVYARAAQRVGIGVNWAGSGASTPSPMQIELIKLLRPSIWLGMSSYAIHLANMADASGIDLSRYGVGLVMCSAEAISAKKREKISRMWGARVHDNFGMTEAGMMGSESRARDGFHIWTDMYAIEVVDLDSGEPVPEGEPGGLVVTPLWSNNATPFLRWSSGDIVTYREEGGADGPLSVFPVIQHAHRTVGFFKIRGVNIDHQEFEDFLFSYEDLIDFKLELVTRDDAEILQVSIEVSGRRDPQQFAARIAGDTRDTFQIKPEIIVLERGTLAREFESALNAPRFTDRRT